MKKYTIGILAHVDAGKTTLIEQLLVASGKKKEAGRVDHGTAFLDTDAQERARGITITSKMCRITVDGYPFILMDTPGHVDFMAESERVLPVLDAAILVIGAGQRIPAHAQYLFSLLKERSIPTVIFFNKMDLPVPKKEELLKIAGTALGEGIVDWYGDPAKRSEEAAVLDENLLELFLSKGELDESILGRLFRRGKLHPCCFGAALQGDGTDALLQLLTHLFTESQTDAPEPFGAYCYKILHGESGERLSFLKILSGSVEVRDMVSYPARSGETDDINEKITRIRAYDGSEFEEISRADAGDIVAVAGLTATYAGCGLGAAPSLKPEVSRPMLRYKLILPEGVDPRLFLPKLRLLEEEEDTLSIDWIPDREEIEVELYGEVQSEILLERIAEAHLLLEPMPRGSGLILESRLSTDELDRNWQQTILNALEQERLTGVLTDSKLTDLKITLVAGRSHKKHTEGGDFREAALRALRQGLMSAECILLEPYVRFQLTVPQAAAGKALFDMDQLASESGITEQTEEQTTVSGRGAISKLRNYIAEVRTYTHGEGLFRMVYDGYDVCPDQEQVMDDIGYQPDADLEKPAGSVFVSHGTADFVPWDEAPERMHLESRFFRFYPEDGMEEDPEQSDAPHKKKASASLSERLESIGTDEIDQILQKAGHANQSGENSKERRNRWSSANHRRSSSKPATARKESPKKYLLVDGYNIIHAWEETKGIVNQNLDAARGILLDMLTEYRAVTEPEIIVVFDAYRVPGHRTEIMDYQNLHVVFTKEAETADKYIARFSLEHSKKYDITVATSDGMIQLIIRGADARVWSARDLREMVRTKKEYIRENYLSE